MNTLPANATEIKVELKAPNEVRKRYEIVTADENGSFVAAFRTEHEARTFMKENKFFKAPKQ